MQFIRPGHLIFHFSVVRFWCSCAYLLALSTVDRGQHGHPDWSAAMQPHTQQTAMHCVFWHLSTKTSINFLSNLSYCSSSIGSACRLTLIHPSSCLGALLIDTDLCRPGTHHKSWPSLLASQLCPCQTHSVKPLRLPIFTSSNTSTLRAKCSLAA